MAAAQAPQDVLASAAQSAIGSVSNLADNVKLGAIALGSDDSDAQVQISIQTVFLPLFKRFFAILHHFLIAPATGAT